MKVHRVFAAALGLFCAWGGLLETQKLLRAHVSEDLFIKTKGTILEVRRHVDSHPGRADSAGANDAVYEVRFAYPAGAGELSASTLSPLCDYCPDQDVRRATGSPPAELKPGTAVPVFVHREDAKLAYLLLPSGRELVGQAAIAALWLIAAPMFLYVWMRAWRRPDDTA